MIGVTMTEYVSVDENVQTTELLSDQDIINEVTHMNDSDDDCESDQDEQPAPILPSLEEGAAACDSILNLIQSFDDADKVCNEMSKVKRYVMDKYINKLYTRQSNIQSYLKDFN